MRSRLPLTVQLTRAQAEWDRQKARVNRLALQRRDTREARADLLKATAAIFEIKLRIKRNEQRKAAA